MVSNNMTEAITNETPLDIIMSMEEQNTIYDELQAERLEVLRLLNDTLLFIIDQKSNNDKAVIYGILYALQDFTTLEYSTRDRAKELGVSSGLISYYTNKYKQVVLDNKI